jgi:hypothetical protein
MVLFLGSQYPLNLIIYQRILAICEPCIQSIVTLSNISCHFETLRTFQTLRFDSGAAASERGIMVIIAFNVAIYAIARGDFA